MRVTACLNWGVKLQFKDRPDLGLLLLRAGIGLMFVIVHGYPKIAGGVAKWKGLGGAFNRFLGLSFFPEFWGFLASLAEFGGGICLIAGVFFRPACALMLFTMAIAVASIIRGGYGFNAASQPIELGLVLLALFFSGPGALTVPNLLSKSKPSR
jgi:putative oxidoreductase